MTMYSAKKRTRQKPDSGMSKVVVLIVISLLIAGTGLTLWLVRQTPPTPPLPPRATPADATVAPQIGPKPQFALNPPAGFEIGVFAAKLGAPRDLVMSPEGILLASIPSQNKIVALPDEDKNGVVDNVYTVAANLNNPHGITFYPIDTASGKQNKLYIVEETRVARYSWDAANLKATEEKFLFDLPRGGNHTTRSIVFNKQGRMFISIGSTCNVCFEKHEWLAAVVTSDSEGNTPQLFAKGLRNAPFLMVNPTTDQLWGTEMGRDYLGDNAPPDEINIIQSNRDYGWPLCWGKKVHDTVFDTNQYLRDPCSNTEAPQFGIAAHSAPLGLIFIESPQFPSDWQNDLLVAYHGSWNRTSPIGYKVVRLNLNGNNVVSEEDFLTGFIDRGGQVSGRPVDLVFDSQGSLYISDDKAGNIYKVIKN